jgi:GAF domain-containing protein
VLGVSVLENGMSDNGLHDDEGVAYLRAAASQIGIAHAALAAYYARAGQTERAEREVRAYIGQESDPTAVHRWIDSARTAFQRSGFAFILVK